MHEAHIMNDLMGHIGRVAAAAGARRVVSIRVRLGGFSHMTPAHFREHFADAARGCIAEGADVHAVESTDRQDPAAMTVVVESVDIE